MVGRVDVPMAVRRPLVDGPGRMGAGDCPGCKSVPHPRRKDVFVVFSDAAVVFVGLLFPSFDSFLCDVVSSFVFVV